MAIAVSALLSAPAQANISMPGGGMYIPGPLGFPGFGIGGHASAGASGHSTGFGLPSPCGFAPCLGPFSFGLNGAPQGGNVSHSDFGISTPFGGINAGGFGIPVPFGAWGGGFGIPDSPKTGLVNHPSFGLPCGFIGPCMPSPLGFGLGGAQSLGVSTPFGGINVGGFGVSTPWGGMSTPFFGLNNQQNIGISTPFGGVYGPGFGFNAGPFSGNFGGWGLNGAQNVGISTPWGGMNAGGFGFGAQPQIMPIYLPYPY